MIVLGCDPGLTGAIAALDTITGELTVMDMPVMKNTKGKGIIDPYALFDMLTPPPGVRCMAVIEQVSAWKGQGVTSSFNFGDRYGQLKMAVAGNKIEVRYVTPAVWKKHFGLSSVKGASQGLARNRFPTNIKDFARVMDHDRAEAALIAVYGYEKLLPKI